jgi:hypothetical protein
MRGGEVDEDKASAEVRRGEVPSSENGVTGRTVSLGVPGMYIGELGLCSLLLVGFLWGALIIR